MTAKEITEELNDMLNGDLDEYGEEGMETTEDAVHEACAAVRAWERIGAELDRIEKEFVFAVCEPECESCIKELFEIFRSTIKRAFEEEGLGLPDKERKIGRWIIEENPTAGRCLQKVYICNICGSAVGCGYFNRRSFCPACGNEMEDPDGTPLTLDRYEEWKKKKVLEEEQRRQAQLDFCRSFREEDANVAEAEPEKFYKEDPETTRRKFLEIMKQGNT